MRFPTLAPGSGLSALEMVPMRTRRFRLERVSPEETGWLADVLNRAGERLGTRVERTEDDRLLLRWG